MSNNKKKNLSKKILFLVNNLEYFISHRIKIADACLNIGYEVIICFGEAKINDLNFIKKRNFIIYDVKMNRGSLNPFADLKTIFAINRIFKNEKPDIVHLITIKPYIYGGIVSRLNLIPCVVTAIPGLGSLFIHNNFKSNLLRWIIYFPIRIAFNHPNQSFIFQNKDDLDYFKNWGILKSKNINILNGSGVDLEIFQKTIEPKGIPVICFAARLIADKGINEFINAAQILIKRKIKCIFWILGDLDEKNPSSLNKYFIDIFKQNRYIKFKGFKKNISKIYENSNIICLPSYREGLPKSLAEAAAAGRSIVTTDVPGCRDCVIHGVTGLLVPAKDSLSLANALNWLIDNPKVREEMGKRGRDLAKKKFSVDNIINKHLKIYHKLIKNVNK